MLSIEHLIQKAQSYRQTIDSQRIQAAFDFVRKVYQGRFRFSGDPYITHLLEVMDILLPLKPDDDTIVASLLHGLLGDTDVKSEEVKERFGPTVASLVESLEALKKMKPNLNSTDIENFRQMLMTVAKDLRVLLIRLADRLHNMETLEHLTPEKQKFIARETMEIYAPLASRLGIYSFKSRLEDLAFRYLNLTQYRNIEEQLSDFGREKGRYIDEIVLTLTKFLQSQDVQCRVEGRIKSIYSIYRKLKRKSRTSIRDIFDIFAIRLIMPTKMEGDRESTEHLYTVLGFIHSRFTPLANRFKDYVAVSKPNGYQSLHTTVVGLAPKIFNQPVEIQIRSERMHRQGEYGIASHWLYEDTHSASVKFQKDLFLEFVRHKETKIPIEDQRLRSQIEWLRALAQLQENFQDEESLVEALKLDIFNDRIFVLTPDGEVKDLPVGATPLDFAYSVHTNVGHCCAMAKVNGRVVSLDHELKNGEVVEIILKQKPNPKPLWLSFVKTNAAKMKIKAWFRGQHRELAFREGKDLLNKQLARFNKAKLDEELSLLKNFSGETLNLRDRQNLVESIGNGSVPANTLIRKLFSQEELMAPIEVTRRKTPKSQPVLEDRILLGGEAGLPLRIAHCCSPQESHPIVGYITRGQSATIHCADCKLLVRASHNRILQASWKHDLDVQTRYRVRIILSAINRIGLIRDLTTVIADMSINILEFGYKEKRENIVTYSIFLEVSSFDQLDRLMNRLELATSVLSVKRED